LRKTLLIVLGIIVLSGCTTTSSLSFSEVSRSNINKDVQSFFQGVRDENGVHLYFDDQNSIVFVYLNGFNVIADAEAMYFTGFNVEDESNTLKLLYTSNQTTNYADSSLEHERFYKVKLDKDYDKIKLFNNGSEAAFSSISGNR